MACPRCAIRLSAQLSRRSSYQASLRLSQLPSRVRTFATAPKPTDQDAKRRRGLYLRLGFGVAFVGLVIYNISTESIQADAPLALQDKFTKASTEINSSSPMRLQMENLIRDHQDQIVTALEKVDGSGKTFFRDSWDRPNNGGGGTSCILQDGNVFEKAGVNISIVYGTLPRPAIIQMRADHKSFVDADVDKLDFFAAGLSLVLHPKNPMAPTVHLNYRYFETYDPNDPSSKNNTWWFGGGTDLTPSYLFPEDASHFHKTIKTACDAHDSTYYPKFKAWCDKYFFIPHRRESRGVGGIFFDDLDSSVSTAPKLFSFVTTCLESFLPSYLPIIERRKNMPFTPEQKEWQQLRRGRYVEFNLVNDRGTSFGLRTPGARVESILMSLPLTARWEYMKEVPQGTKEEEVLSVLREPKEWA